MLSWIAMLIACASVSWLLVNLFVLSNRIRRLREELSDLKYKLTLHNASKDAYMEAYLKEKAILETLAERFDCMKDVHSLREKLY